jgi:hypothetical protein
MPSREGSRAASGLGSPNRSLSLSIAFAKRIIGSSGVDPRPELEINEIRLVSSIEVSLSAD